MTLGFPIFSCENPPHSCVHSRFAEQINIWSSNFFLPRFTLESISYSPGCRVTRRILSHRYATSLDETACASFHLKIRKLGEELFFSDLFIGINSCTKLQYYTESSLSPPISIQLNFASDTSALVIIDQRFPVCMFAFPNSCQCVRPYMIWTWCCLNFHQSPPGFVKPFQESFVQ